MRAALLSLVAVIAALVGLVIVAINLRAHQKTPEQILEEIQPIIEAGLPGHKSRTTIERIMQDRLRYGEQGFAHMVEVWDTGRYDDVIRQYPDSNLAGLAALYAGMSGSKSLEEAERYLNLTMEICHDCGVYEITGEPIASRARYELAKVKLEEARALFGATHLPPCSLGITPCSNASEPKVAARHSSPIGLSSGLGFSR